MTFDYVASPYTDPDPAVMHERFVLARYYTAWCLANGEYVYSPIIHCHELACEFQLPRDYAFWRDYNRAMLGGASELRILCIPGHKESTGVRGEVWHARELGMRVKEVPYDLVLTARDEMRGRRR